MENIFLLRGVVDSSMFRCALCGRPGVFVCGCYRCGYILCLRWECIDVHIAWGSPEDRMDHFCLPLDPDPEDEFLGSILVLL